MPAVQIEFSAIAVIIVAVIGLFGTISVVMIKGISDKGIEMGKVQKDFADARKADFDTLMQLRKAVQETCDQFKLDNTNLKASAIQMELQVKLLNARILNLESINKELEDRVENLREINTSLSEQLVAMKEEVRKITEYNMVLVERTQIINTENIILKGRLEMSEESSG